jgi:CDGSH-type Zn-finger protein
VLFETRRLIYARFCVTGAPDVFLANVQGPWIHPDAMDTEELPPVNLLTVREAGPYAVRAPIVLEGAPTGFRATLCRCGASRNKPFCDSSHHDIGFAASGEPATGSAEALAMRNGPLAIDPQLDGPLQVRGNLAITSGTERVVARIQSARLCRCGASQNKPFCDNSHQRIGFKSANEPAPNTG